MTLRTLVVGAGAIGGYFGGRMLAHGHDVTFLVRPRRAAQLAEHGLIVRSPRGDLDIPAPPTVQAGGIGAPFDAVLLSCKAYDLEDAMAALEPAIGPGTRILPLLNGLKHLELLAARFGEDAVLGGECKISTTLEPDGTVRQFGEMQALSLGERHGANGETAQALAEALEPAGGRLSTAILQEMWEKWVIISTVAATTCLMRAPIGDVVAGGGADIARGILAEAAAIAARNHHPMRDAARARLETTVTTPGSPFAASMLRDIERGNAVEADHILGDLLSRGEPGVAPLLRLAYVHLKAYESRRLREAQSKSA